MSAPRHLRQWQDECLTKLVGLWQQKRRALVVATPGAGKTTLALTFARNRIQAGEVEHLHIIAPTRPLRQHWQDAGREFGLALGRRSNARLKNIDLPFDVSGVVATYAQVASDPDAHFALIEGRRSLVILDEVHHAGDRRAWGEGVIEAFEDARFVLSLSGTPFRMDDAAISLVTYGPDGVAIADFPYTYSRAIGDNVCRTVIFRPYNALVEYRAQGERCANSFTDTLPEREMSDLLRHALHPEAGLIAQMVRDADDELSALRSRGPRWADAAGLMVCMSQAHAYACAEIVREVTGEQPAVIVSDDDAAEDNLNAFKQGMGRWCIAVRMVSEGVDIPRLMVSVYATNVVSTLFFRQFVGRTVRVRHQAMDEVSTIFLPADDRLITQVRDIEKEVEQGIRDLPPDSYRSVRARVGQAERKLYEVTPKISRIECGAYHYRGETFTDQDLYAANAKRHLFPEHWEPVHIAWTLRQIARGEAA